MQVPPFLDLTGRVAIVTGAGSPTGIGYAAARHLGMLGAAVVVGATTERAHERAAELGAEGIAAQGFVGDLTDPVVAEELARQARSSHGRIDVVVNNAGMVSTSDPDYLEGDLLATTPQRWSDSLRRNLDTAYLVTRAALPHLRESGHGRVITVASVTGAAMAMRGEVAYAAAKAALVGLTRALAVDEARHGITANAVAPGWIATASQTEHEVAEGLITPVGRSGTADEVASTIAWLATTGAGYVNGQMVVVDGGNGVAEERALPR